MKLTVQLVPHPDDDTETIVREVFTLQRKDPLAPDTLGLRLDEAKDLVVAVQDTLIVEQVTTAVSAQVDCPDCGAARRHQDSRPIVMTTLFGRLRWEHPRWWHCGCQPLDEPHLQPVGFATPAAEHPGAVLPPRPLRRAGLLRDLR